MSRTVRIRASRKNDQGLDCVLLVRETGEEKIISPTFRFPKEPGWGLPGGRVHPGEDMLEAAIREFYEETGLQATFPMDPLARIMHNENHIILLYEPATVSGVIAPRDKNIVKAEWIPLAYLMPDVDGQIKPLPDNGKDYNVYRMHYPMILKDFAKVALV